MKVTRGAESGGHGGGDDAHFKDRSSSLGAALQMETKKILPEKTQFSPPHPAGLELICSHFFAFSALSFFLSSFPPLVCRLWESSPQDPVELKVLK